MDYDAIRGGLEQAIPFNRHIGLQVGDVGPNSGVITLPDRDELRNHVGSQHAAALFGAGEAASGAAFVGAFAERLGDLTPLAQGARIEYKKIAKGAITAKGTLSSERDELLATLDADGKVQFTVEVELTNAGGDVVARMSVDWHVKKNA